MEINFNSFEKDDAQYHQLYCQCPICVANGKTVPPSFWIHAGCGGDIYIGDNAHLYCSLCGKESHVTCSTYACPEHCNVDEKLVDLDYRPYIPDFHTPPLGLLVKVAGIVWLRKYLKNLE